MFTSRKLLIHNRPYIITAFYTVDDYLANSRTVLQNNFTDYIVTDRNLEVQYSSMASGGSKLQNRILSKVTDNDKPRYFSNGVLYYKRVISIGWDIITFSSWYVIFKEIFLILSVVLIFYFLPPVLFYINIIPTNQKFLQPLAALTKQIADYSAGQDLVLDIHTGDEIEQLGTSVNKMIIKINNQIEEIKRKEHENCITHYSLLATEIDPHFIYNTLSIINSMARQVGQNDIVEVNTALGKILRERFSTKTSVFETISSSLDTIQQYHTIMKYRYNNQVQISINAETIILREKIPKNLLIPIIENSYYHGLTNDTGNICGEIEVTIYSLSDEIVIEISDDGAGMSPERLQYIKNHHFQSPETDRAHIGFSNVYERLNYIYRNNFSIDLTSSLGFGTTVSITVPKYNETFEF